jgi:hypothetical protein
MTGAGTDALGVLRWGMRRYGLLFVLCLLLGVVVAPLAVLQRTELSQAEALIVAREPRIPLSALPRYGTAVFNNGVVERAVADRFTGLDDDGSIVPDRVDLVAEQDSIVFTVLGRDPDPETAADLANAAADAFIETLNSAGAGVAQFILQSPAEPPIAGDEGRLEMVLAIAVGLAAGTLLGFGAVTAVLIARRPVIDSADATRVSGVPALGTVTLPRARGGVPADPEQYSGLIPVCRRLLALPTPTLVMTSRSRDETVRRQVSEALVRILERVRDVRFLRSSEPRTGRADARSSDPASDRFDGRPDGRSQVVVVDSSEPLDLIQPPQSTAVVLVIREGIGSSALRAAVAEHLGATAQAYLVMVRRRRRRPAKSPSAGTVTRRSEQLQPVGTSERG